MSAQAPPDSPAQSSFHDRAVGPPALQVQLSRPTSTSVLAQVSGELDADGAGRLQELVAPRLSSTVEFLVLDLSQLAFIGVAGLELLSHVHRRASHRGVQLRLVTGPRCLDRALLAAGMTETFACYPSRERALSGLSGYLRELDLVG